MLSFTTLTDITHTALGFIAATLILQNNLLLGALITALFTVYQILDHIQGEDPKETLGDAKEFVSGFGGAVAIYAAAQAGLVQLLK